MNGVQPVNITGAAIVAQISLFVIMFVGALIVRRSERDAYHERRPSYAGLAWVILAMSLSTLVMLGATDAFTPIWKPVVNNPGGYLFSWSGALLGTFLVDIACVALIVLQTGGSRSSPFQGIYFLLPTLAILLRESLGRVILYSVLVAVAFSIGIPRGFDAKDDIRHRLSYWLVSIATMVLAVVIGYLTRPP